MSIHLINLPPDFTLAFFDTFPKDFRDGSVFISNAFLTSDTDIPSKLEYFWICGCSLINQRNEFKPLRNQLPKVFQLAGWICMDHPKFPAVTGKRIVRHSHLLLENLPTIINHLLKK